MEATWRLNVRSSVPYPKYDNVENRSRSRFKLQKASHDAVDMTKKFNVRQATREDIPDIVSMIHALAEFKRDGGHDRKITAEGSYNFRAK